MKLIIDASVVVKWFVDEDDFEIARLLVEPGIERIAPDLVIAESINVLQRKARFGELSHEQALDAVQRLSYFFDDLVSSAVLIERGYQLSWLLDHSVYDCMYLALALQSDDCTLVTSDMKFVSKAVKAGFADKIWTLEVVTRALATQ